MYPTDLETLDKGSRVAGFLLKIYRDFKQMMVEINIKEAFAAVRFTHHIDQIPYGLPFENEAFRPNPGFADLQKRNPLLESLLKRRRKSKFGWTTKLA
jgi:hypothetical protein